MVNVKKKKTAREIVYSESSLDGRRIITIKAEGPGGTVGKPGDAIKKIVQTKKGKISRDCNWTL